MEEREPGYKAAKASKARTREAERLIRRAQHIERYGSEEAVLAPCEREQKLRAALAAWMTPCDPPHERWTNLIDGECSSMHGISEHIMEALGAAYPWPSTVAEALVEYEYWCARETEIEDVLGNPMGYEMLDRTADFRFEAVRRLLRKDLPIKTLNDFRARFAYFSKMQEEGISADLYADFERLVKRGEIIGA